MGIFWLDFVRKHLVGENPPKKVGGGKILQKSWWGKKSLQKIGGGIFPHKWGKKTLLIIQISYNDMCICYSNFV